MDKVFDLHTVQVMADAMKDSTEQREVHLFEYDGVCFANTNVKKETLSNDMPKWKARTDDAFVVTYPKAGTTWTQEIMYLAMNGGNTEEAQKGHTMFRIPYLEANFQPPKIKWFAHPLKALIFLWCSLKILFRMLLFSIKQGRFSIPSTLDIMDMMPSPRLLKSHLPAHLLPPDIYAKKSKIVYVTRNPKDVAVSFYHFHKWVKDLPQYDSWDAFFDDFMTGNVTNGKWYEHYLGYWKKRDEENILFLKFEDMKKDEKAAVKQICEFLGYHYSDEIIDRITRHTTFGSMKKNPMTNPDSLMEKKDVSFMRKGVVGDWKNYFSDAQNKAIEALCEEKFKGTGLTFEFE
ncbi:sulfotransferase 1C4-like [Amphiura filiformis]|uniref:sulfotransferase 1C4-like n=1 Tax=Amphiura filiformis TaxID=82378 RepID=UPI003B216C1E